jgi:hypothetical protein
MPWAQKLQRNIFPRYVKTKTNYDKSRLNLIINIKYENKKQNMKCARQKCKLYFIMITYEIMNMK